MLGGLRKQRDAAGEKSEQLQPVFAQQWQAVKAEVNELFDSLADALSIESGGTSIRKLSRSTSPPWGVCRGTPAWAHSACGIEGRPKGTAGISTHRVPVRVRDSPAARAPFMKVGEQAPLPRAIAL